MTGYYSSEHYTPYLFASFVLLVLKTINVFILLTINIKPRFFAGFRKISQMSSSVTISIFVK